MSLAPYARHEDARPGSTRNDADGGPRKRLKIDLEANEGGPGFRGRIATNRVSEPRPTPGGIIATLDQISDVAFASRGSRNMPAGG
jgi:hypothetical protein